MGITNLLNNTILGNARFGTTVSNPLTQAAISPTISSEGITTGLWINPTYSPSSGTFFGEQIQPVVNPQSGIATSIMGLSIAPTISGSVTNAYGLNIAAASGTGSIVSSTGLYVTNVAGGSILQNYTAILGTDMSARVGVANPTPAYPLDIAGVLSVHRIFHGKTLQNNQLINLAQGSNQGGFGGGSVGANLSISKNTIDTFDLAANLSSNLSASGETLFNGAVFDGRYIYFVPNYVTEYAGTAVRYDTFGSYSSKSSYTLFDLTRISTFCKGFSGGIFDGRYVYFIPSSLSAPNTRTGTIVRYDTTLSFVVTSSFTTFNLSSLNPNCSGYSGGAFDGRYIYFSPTINDFGDHGFAVRFDSTQSFTASGSYSVFDMTRANASCKPFFGALYDGRYVYYVPVFGRPGLSLLTQYDTTLPFSSVSSYTTFSLNQLDSAHLYYGGVFDGRYIYLAPGQSSSIIRYDTMQSFVASGSYTLFNIQAFGAGNTPYLSGIFDGRYVYFAPFNNTEAGVSYSVLTRFDTTQSFNNPASYTCFNLSSVNTQSIGFAGGIFDGRFVYLAPNSTAMLTRISAYAGPQATAMAASQAPNGFAIGSYAGTQPPAGGMLVGTNIGISTASPQFNVDVNGIIYCQSLIATNAYITPAYVSMGVYATGGTTRNQLINLAEGYDQGGFGGGSVGTNKLISANSFTTFNLLQSTGAPVSKAGAVFDGRYIYLSPKGNSAPGDSSVTRYDTTLPFSNVGSYTTFNLLQVSPNCSGYRSGVFDGRYLYFVPYFTTSMVRYDTQLNFNSPVSYTVFNVSQVGNTQSLYGGVFDGRYIYFPPGQTADPTVNSVTTLRYDTTRSFTATSSYTAFSFLPLVQTPYYAGGVFDGRYVYFNPVALVGTVAATIVRYDTTLSFNAIGSYTTYGPLISGGYDRYTVGLFDGRYVYFASNGGKFIVRYDTALDFRSTGSFTNFDTSRVMPDQTIIGGFASAAFDGRYIYFAPWAGNSTILQYDTTQNFNTPGSYTVFTSNGSDLGAVYDGRYVYFVPSSVGSWVRIDAYPGPQANAIAASQAPNGLAVGNYAGTAAANNQLIISSRLGVDTASPQYPVDVLGTLVASNFSATNFLPSQIYATAGTTRNQRITLAEGTNQGGVSGGSVGTNKLVSANTTQYFDTTLVGGYSYNGAIFDGRYLYLIPLGRAGGPSSATITRYDSTQPFSSVSSYTSYSLLNVSSNSLGYRGALFDGRYIYMVPLATTFSTRYDTFQNFNSADSYTTFDVNQIGNSTGGYGGVFDGRYVYFCPFGSATMTRYDSTLPFTLASSYTAVSLAPVTQQRTFGGGVFDGRYIYLVPIFAVSTIDDFSVTIVRYDTTLSFTSQSSFTSFDLSLISVYTQYVGGVFDGRYVYLVPLKYGTVTRYDTQQNFNSPGSYTTFNVNPILGINTAGFSGGTFDGRYIYFAPWTRGILLAYDTTKNFNSSGSYTVYNTEPNAGNGFIGATFDGRYVYFIPNENTTIIRIDAYPGPQATAMAANQAPNGFAIGSYAGTGSSFNGANASALIISGNVGINTSSPQYPLDVNGTINPLAWSIDNNNIYYGPSGLLGKNELLTVSTGYTQGLGSGSVGTNKALNAQTALVFDTTTVDPGSLGFQGSGFDGRYLYLAPNSSGQITQYDTMQPFSAAASYSVFNMAALNASASGFSGALFDGRYLYFVPSSQRQIARYDTTTLLFRGAGSYSFFDLTTVSSAAPGYAGGAFDGRYIYLAANADVNGVSGTITRFDTAAAFNTASSYTCFDTRSLSAGAAGYFGAAYDGRYIYFVPGTDSGTISQYDTSQSFNNSSSWTLFDLTQLQPGCKGYRGAAFDGRFIYFAPYSNSSGLCGTIARYDTTQSFNAISSYTLFDMTTISLGCKGYAGAAFDGRYVYFSPGASTSGTVVRFDTTLSFNAISSYTTLDLSVLGSCRGYVGCAFDGQSIYFVPYNNSSPFGAVVRIDAYSGPQTTAVTAGQAPNGLAVGSYAGSGLNNGSPAAGLSYYNALVVSGNVGIGTANPSHLLELSTADSAAKPTTTTWTIASDVRIKRKIEDVTDGLGILSQLRPRQFTFHPDYAKDIGVDPNKKQFGFIADEVEPVLSGCVQNTLRHCYGGKMREWFDQGACGSMPAPIPGLTNLKSFNMHNILIYYIRAINELAAIQEQLQEKIDRLTKK